MWEDEIAYYHRRAEAEIAAAERSNDSGVVAAHYRLSELYFDLAQAWLQSTDAKRTDKAS